MQNTKYMTTTNEFALLGEKLGWYNTEVSLDTELGFGVKYSTLRD